MIRYTYSNQPPPIKRQQGGILYPAKIEQVVVKDDAAETVQYRFFLLKFADQGAVDIRDYSAFTELYQEKIDSYFAADIDWQAVSPKSPEWINAVDTGVVVLH